MRLRLLSLVAAHPGGEACACDLQDAFDLSQPHDRPPPHGARGGRAADPRTPAPQTPAPRTLVAGAALIALFLALQPVSAAFDPVVTLVERARGLVSTRDILVLVIVARMFSDTRFFSDAVHVLYPPVSLPEETR